uniref:Uncharacterized protein n=1 Tax=Chrysotila carterae TaxID=13221 RepID=A0A7S4BSD8_CHRCT|mmetsp:Transcript_13818/g.26983  ORF Transcript_13818/g.26983 Transcript_13818/m.26983 type:complete len:170 (+) Transcript_13818:249-758(+)
MLPKRQPNHVLSPLLPSSAANNASQSSDAPLRSPRGGARPLGLVAQDKGEHSAIRARVPAPVKSPSDWNSTDVPSEPMSSSSRKAVTPTLPAVSERLQKWRRQSIKPMLRSMKPGTAIATSGKWVLDGNNTRLSRKISDASEQSGDPTQERLLLDMIPAWGVFLRHTCH